MSLPVPLPELQQRVDDILKVSNNTTFAGVRRKLEHDLMLPEGALDSHKETVNAIISALLKGEEPNLAALTPAAEGGASTRWVADQDRRECPQCGKAFSLVCRRHHCRLCGEVVCAACSPHKVVYPSPFFFNASNEPIRVCSRCYQEISAEEAPEDHGHAGGQGALPPSSAAATAAAAAATAGAGLDDDDSSSDDDDEIEYEEGPGSLFLTGTWTADEARSKTTLDPLYQFLGVGMMQRKVLKRLKITTTLQHLEEEFTVCDKMSVGSNEGDRQQRFPLNGEETELTDKQGRTRRVRVQENRAEGSVTMTSIVEGVGTIVHKRVLTEDGAELHNKIVCTKTDGKTYEAERVLVRTPDSCAPHRRVKGGKAAPPPAPTGPAPSAQAQAKMDRAKAREGQQRRRISKRFKDRLAAALIALTVLLSYLFQGASVDVTAPDGTKYYTADAGAFVLALGAATTASRSSQVATMPGNRALFIVVAMAFAVAFF